MKTQRFKFSYRANASKLHRKVGDTLRNSSIFQNYQIYQEYPVIRINPSIKNSKLRFDWVIIELQLVIECQGKQHAQPVNFGGHKRVSKAFRQLKERDALKKQAALDRGWTYIEIWYNEIDDITDNLIYDRYTTSIVKEQLELDQPAEVNKYKIEQQKKAKEYRKKQYQKRKEWLKKIKREKIK